MYNDLAAVLLFVVIGIFAYPVYKWICGVSRELDDCSGCDDYDDYLPIDKRDHMQ